MGEATPADLDFLVENTHIARWGCHLLRETTLCVMCVGVVATKGGTYKGKEYAEGENIYDLTESNHGWGSWYPSESELRMPKGVKLSEDARRIVYAED